MERKHEMAKKNQYELIENSVIDDGAFLLEPYDDWKENIAFLIKVPIYRLLYIQLTLLL